MKETLENLVGLALTDPRVPTPSCVIDLPKLTHNIERAKARAAALQVAWRAHLKRH